MSCAIIYPKPCLGEIYIYISDVHVATAVIRHWAQHDVQLVDTMMQQHVDYVSYHNAKPWWQYHHALLRSCTVKMCKQMQPVQR